MENSFAALIENSKQAVKYWWLLLLLVFAACASCFEWLFPWAATNIPALQEMSNYTAI